MLVTPASSSGARPPRSESTPVAALDWATKEAISRRWSPSGTDVVLREATEREPARDADGRRRDDLRGQHADDGLGEPVVRADGDPRQAQRHGPGEKGRPDVVPAPQVQRRAGAALERLRQRDHSRHEERIAQARRSKGGEDEQAGAADDRAGDLEPERAAVEAAQPSPVLARDVAEPVLDERLLHRQVEERLEEARRVDDRRVVAERPRRRKHAARDDGRGEPERRRTSRCRQPSTERRTKSRLIGRRQYSCRSLTTSSASTGAPGGAGSRADRVARRARARRRDPDSLPARQVPARLRRALRRDDAERVSLGLRRARRRRSSRPRAECGTASRHLRAAGGSGSPASSTSRGCSPRSRTDAGTTPPTRGTRTR